MLAHLGKPGFSTVSLATLKSSHYATASINGSNTADNQLTASYRK